MQFRTSAITGQASPHPPWAGAGLSDAMAAVVGGARRRAVRDGDRHVDTAHLLHSLVESDPEVRGAFDGGPQLARVLGYLVQRSIGYGLRWQGTQEGAGALPAIRGPGAEGLSPSAAVALECAARAAARRGEPRADGLDLLAELVADPRCRAVEVLERAGGVTARLAARAADRSAVPDARG
ncbi:peptidase [Streptomyces sp. NPDC006516]|uniref:peptidase n=1 Tax=Streptomyces sp. NPDC006516 TaxID=3154309 RepID=UPI0033B6DE9A